MSKQLQYTNNGIDNINQTITIYMILKRNINELLNTSLKFTKENCCKSRTCTKNDMTIDNESVNLALYWQLQLRRHFFDRLQTFANNFKLISKYLKPCFFIQRKYISGLVGHITILYGLRLYSSNIVYIYIYKYLTRP